MMGTKMMHTWTSIATAISALLSLSTAAVNFATVIRTRRRSEDQQQDNHCDDEP
jgi:hypothetical protein